MHISSLHKKKTVRVRACACVCGARPLPPGLPPSLLLTHAEPSVPRGLCRPGRGRLASRTKDARPGGTGSPGPGPPARSRPPCASPGPLHPRQENPDASALRAGTAACARAHAHAHAHALSAPACPPNTSVPACTSGLWTSRGALVRTPSCPPSTRAPCHQRRQPLHTRTHTRTHTQGELPPRTRHSPHPRAGSSVAPAAQCASRSPPPCAFSAHEDLSRQKTVSSFEKVLSKAFYLLFLLPFHNWRLCVCVKSLLLVFLAKQKICIFFPGRKILSVCLSPMQTHSHRGTFLLSRRQAPPVGPALWTCQ